MEHGLPISPINSAVYLYKEREQALLVASTITFSEVKPTLFDKEKG
jgi:hypothetical protein